MLLMGGFGVKMKMSQAGKHMHEIGSLKKQSHGRGAGGGGHHRSLQLLDERGDWESRGNGLRSL